MNTAAKRLVSVSLSLAVLAPALLTSACNSKTRSKTVIAEDSTWYDSSVSVVDNGLDPAE